MYVFIFTYARRWQHNVVGYILTRLHLMFVLLKCQSLSKLDCLAFERTASSSLCFFHKIMKQPTSLFQASCMMRCAGMLGRFLVVKAHPLIVDWIWGSTWFVFVVFVAGQPRFKKTQLQLAYFGYDFIRMSYLSLITIYYICHFDMFWLFTSPFFHHYIIYHAYTSALFTYICTYAYSIHTYIHRYTWFSLVPIPSKRLLR